MSTIFVTGTDTGVGKTLVSSLLIQHFVSLGLKTSGYKPVASGAEKTESGLRNDDAEILMAVSNAGLSYEEINPYVFEPPIAPHIAAEHAGININPVELTKHYHNIIKHADVVVVEGAGGWQVPLNSDVTFADWISQTQWPVLLVVGVRLGCINHALLTYENILASGNKLVGWVANCVTSDVAETENIKSYLKAKISAPLLGDIPLLQESEYQLASKYVDFSVLNNESLS